MPNGILDMLGIDPVANRNKKERLMLQELQGKQALALEDKRGSNTIANTRVSGDENRKSTVQQGEIQKALQTLLAAQGIEKATHDQVLDYATKLGIPYSKENVKVADQALTDPRIQGALHQATLMNQARAQPQFAKTMQTGMNAANLEPVFKNMQTGTAQVSPGSMTVVPPNGAAIPPSDMNQWNQMQGALQNQTINEIASPIPGMPTQVKVTNEQRPGGVRISPELLQQAAMQPSAPMPGGPAMPQAGQPMDPNIMRMLQQLRYPPRPQY